MSRHIFILTIVALILCSTMLSYGYSGVEAEDVSQEYYILVPEDVEPGLYDLYIVFENGSRLWIPRSVWVIEQGFSSEFRVAHISDIHFFAFEHEFNKLKFTGNLLVQLLGTQLILNTGDEADTADYRQYCESRVYHWMFHYSTPMLLVPGNHDHGSNYFEEYYGDREWYRVIDNKILVTAIYTGDQGVPSTESLNWLKTVLETYKNLPVKIVMMHHPVFYFQGVIEASYNSPIFTDPHTDPNSPLSYYWGSDIDKTRHFLKMVEDYNVTIVLAGHIHRDQYVKYVSTRTGTTTYFITTTTMGQSRPNYNGIQILDLRSDGNFTFPYKPPTFSGFENVDRQKVNNSIPIDPSWWAGYFYGTFSKSNYAYHFTLINQLYKNYTVDQNISKLVLIALPWAGDQVGLEVIDSNGTACVELVDYMIMDNMLYALMNITLNKRDYIDFIIYALEDTRPPEATLKLIIPSPPKLNRSTKIYVDIIDYEWGVRDVYGYLIVGNKSTPLDYTRTGDTYMFTVLVTGNETTNATLRIIAYDLAGNMLDKNFTITFYTPTQSILVENPVVDENSVKDIEYNISPLPDLYSIFTPIPTEDVGPGKPAILYPGEYYMVTFKTPLSGIVGAYISGVFIEDDSLVYREYGVEISIEEPTTTITTLTNTTTSTPPVTSPTTTPTTPATTTTPTTMLTTTPTTTTSSTITPTETTTPTTTPTTSPLTPTTTLSTSTSTTPYSTTTSKTTLTETTKPPPEIGTIALIVIVLAVAIIAIAIILLKR